MKEEWISIKEASEKLNVTPQAIYKRLNSTQFKPYVKMFNNKKLINVKALGYFDSTQVDNNSTQVDNRISSDFTEILEIMNKTVDVLKDQVSVLNHQLEQKDKQIEDLNNRLEQSLKNTSEGHFVLAQHQQQKAIGEIENSDKLKPWYKKIFNR